ncbi:DUF1003 domain-containing protein [Hansschlegelia zhihuaiae]|uniref:DUF1003 domain-containing protein n=1 Tax=Hansschlegelia zhihuaiae TaxID=405005 RepID=A0A4Q0MMI4_9HYPH|nr:DUF1003 domain-containing protein [Hansschlegelia zhihuaiae]RXF74685.1 DUF1003 domain-containing protein [Hansschlegelia zhihuaiae]
MAHEATSDLHHKALHWLGRGAETLHEGERRVLESARNRRVVARPPDHARDADLGARLADRVAEFGGSWTFILLFCAVLFLWTGANVWLLTRPFDPYPFIFLNLLLSMLAALQAPVIMMSQNRQAAKDRENAALDYEVNLKAEIEIMALHEKLDRMRDEHLAGLIAKQQEQIDLLTRALDTHLECKGS